MIDDRRLAFVADLRTRTAFSLKFDERIGASGLTGAVCMSGPRKAPGRMTHDPHERYDRNGRAAASGGEATPSERREEERQRGAT